MQNRISSKRKGMSLIGALLIIVLVLALGWTALQVSTKGWEQTRQDMRSAFQGVAYAAKETSEDAALTAKVKQGGVVTLRGDVPTEEARTRAESIAQDVPGVQEVQNHLFVASPHR